MIKVAFFHPSSSITAGSTQSLIKLILGLQDNNVECYIILSRKGNIEEILKKEKINYFVVNDYANNYWTIPDETDTSSIKFYFEYFVKCILNYFQILKATRICKKEKIDIIHINTVTCCQGALVARRLNKPLVWHIREFMEEDLGVRFYHINRARKLINSSKCIIAISKSVKEKFVPLLQNNYIKVIYNGIEIDKYYSKRTILENDSTVTLSITGRINYKKGQHEFLLAIAKLNKNIKERIHCNIIGECLDTNYDLYLKKIIKENHLENITTFVGFTKHIEKYLVNTDILCVCSRKEAFGRVTVEGMQAGCLVIGTNSGGTKEIINDSITGFLYTPGDIDNLSFCIERAISNPTDSQIIAQRGQAIALKKFTDKINTEKVMGVYEEILREC